MARSKSTGGRTSRKINETPREEQMASPARAPETTHLNPGVPQTAGSQTRTEQLAEASPSSEARRLGVVKSEPRKKVVVPINLEDEIRRRAYEIYEHRGNAPGSEAEDWLIAEREVRERYQKQQQSA